jgi:wyosine [tRNA(Phe)-imidazoG37] synthetase (radical SAM superfamily)
MPWGREVVRDLEDALRRFPTVDCLTFSGNGEPTLHPGFGEIARSARELRDRLAPGIKLALFSNSTTVDRPAVQRALRHFDVVMMKLDAGDAQTMAAINRPTPGVLVQDLVEGLANTPGVMVQTVLIRGSASNVEGAPYDAWVAAIKAIKPRRIYVYSTEYPVPGAGIVAVAPRELTCIARDVERRTGLEVCARWLAD